MVVYGSKQFVCCWWSTSWLYMYFQNRNFWNNNFVNWFINYCNHVFWDYCFFAKEWNQKDQWRMLWCSIRFAMHVYMVVKLLLLTMPTLYEIIVWWIFVVHVWQIVMSTLYFMWNHSLAAFHQFYSFLELSEVPVYFFFKFFFLKRMTFFSIQLSHGYSSG